MMQRILAGAAVLFLAAACVILPGSFADKALEAKSRVRIISSEDFIASPAGEAFQRADYDKALKEIDKLLEKYPGDTLLLRYRAMALDFLGRSDEAIKIYQDLLIETPDHVPTRYFLGQAYARSGKTDKANEEWRQVSKEAEGTTYGEWANDALARSGDVTQPPAAAARLRRWTVTARYGYEYDSNVILKPNDKSLASTADPNAGRQLMDLAVRYRAWSNRDTAVDILYAVSQTVHDDSLNEFNYHSEELGANIRHRVKIGNQDVVLGLRYEVLLGILDTDFFSIRNRWHLSADTRFSERTRTVFYDRMTVANYGPDGFDPSRTSRDGFYNDVGITHYIYSEDFQKHVFLRQEFNSSHTDGNNFDTVGTTTRLGLHTPLIGRLDFDASTGLELGFYHNFSSISTGDTSRRRDINWDTYTALTYHLTEELGLRVFYRYINAENRNNFYDYDRQIGGVQLIYTRSF